MIHVHCLIVAGGVGKRFGSPIPKQFSLLHNVPVMVRAIGQFMAYSPDIQIVIVMNKDYIEHWRNTCNALGFNQPHHVVAGGDTRFESVQNGLAAMPQSGYVAIHDAVRPLVSAHTIERCFEKAFAQGNAIPYVPLTESIREIDQTINRQADRSRYVVVQTPQVFELSLVKKAYTQQYNPLFTDDASVVEQMGVPIHLVEGNVENIKITNQTDLLVAAALLKNTMI